MTRDRILCATDFSAESAAALAWAVAVAQRDGAVVDLIHVDPAPTQSFEALAADAGVFEAERRRRAGVTLGETAEAAARRSGVTVQPAMLAGDAHRELTDHAEKTGARLIVMGACGRSALERSLLGSVADCTLRIAKCPVVVVPAELPAAAWRPGDGAPHAPRVVVGMDGEGGSPEVLRFVADLRRAAPCDVTFVHLYWPIEEYIRLGLRGPRDFSAPDPDVVKNLEPKLRAAIDGLPGRGAVSLQVRPAWGEPAANLAMAASDAAADLLVVGTSRRARLARRLGGTIAGRLARRTRLAVACVPSGLGAAAKQPAGIPSILTVLAATDLSPGGNAAVARACSLLRATGGVLELCYVNERSLPSPAYAYDGAGERLDDGRRAALETQLRALVPAEAEALGITTHVNVIDGGRAAEAIVQTAERLNADVISLASHGRNGLARTVLGSVAQEVVQRAHRPVFVVRGPEL